MEHPKQSQESMAARVMRFDELKQKGIPIMFIDSMLPRHMRMNYAVIGDTASENPDFSIQRAITEPHRYQIGIMWAPPGCGPAWHTHDYIESFFMLTGPWTFYWGNEDDPDKVEGEFVLKAWDMISLPPGMYRSFEYSGDEIGWVYAVLEAHEVFEGKDPYWSPQIEAAASANGYAADERGKMVHPPDYETQKAAQNEYLLKTFRERAGVDLQDFRPPRK
ncbi:MAG: cupin domain-containing protein [Chloroflexota bacterium]|nr:cupin domain-containing protein [Chloroflexota bacterium]MDE2908838.1 cupin domain-containing protein [Chloroflexota bacterium]